MKPINSLYGNRFDGLPEQWTSMTAVSAQPRLASRDLGKRSKKQKWLVDCYYMMDAFNMDFDSEQEAKEFIKTAMSQGATNQSPYGDKKYAKTQWLQRFDSKFNGKDVDVLAALEKRYGNVYMLWERHVPYGEKKEASPLRGNKSADSIVANTLAEAKAKARDLLKTAYPSATSKFK